jgi:hypothetical protein
LATTPARPAPAVERAPRKVGEPARRAGLGQALRFSDSELVSDGPDQALVARQTKDVVDAVHPAPRHQLVAGKARIGAQQGLDPRPPGTDLADDTGDLIGAAGGRIDIGPPELGGEQVAAAEHVQRQVAVAVVDPMQASVPGPSKGRHTQQQRRRNA